MALSHRRVVDVPVAIRRYEQMLDHAVRAEQVDAIHKQVGIRRNALIDGARQFEPLPVVAAVPGALIGLEQRHETLNQQGQIEGI